MAQIDNLGNGTGKCWITDSSGATGGTSGIVSCINNDINARAVLFSHALSNKGIRKGSNASPSASYPFAQTTKLRTGSVSQYRYWMYAS